MIIDDITNDFYKKTSEAWLQHLKEYLIKNLADIGFTFCNNEEFLKFCKERITKISFTDKPDEHYFFIDYIDQEIKGICIGMYSDKIEIKENGNTISASIGKNFEDYEKPKTKI